MRADRPGFTLLELIVALALGGFVLLGVVALVDGVGAAASRIGDDARARDAAGAATALLLALLARAEAPPGEVAVFSGTPDALAFRSWCETPGGWLARCRVRVRLAALGDTARALVASWERRPALALGTLPPRAHFAFRETGPDGVAWLREWGEGIRPPDVLGLVMDGDTLLLPVGAGR